MMFIILYFLFLSSNPYCDIGGSFYIVDSKNEAHYTVFEEESAVSADLIVFEHENRLFADRPAHWVFVDNEAFSDFRIYFTKKKSEAEFSVFFTDFESFAGCNL